MCLVDIDTYFSCVLAVLANTLVSTFEELMMLIKYVLKLLNCNYILFPIGLNCYLRNAESLRLVAGG
jgi:hypothetical protein